MTRDLDIYYLQPGHYVRVFLKQDYILWPQSILRLGYRIEVMKLLRFSYIVPSKILTSYLCNKN